MTRSPQTRPLPTMFTDALGSGANTTVTKRLSCENRGSCSEYFAAGQEMRPSFAR